MCLSLLGSHQHIVLQTMLASEARYPLEKALKNNKQQRTEGCYLGPKILESVLVSLIQSGLAEKCEIFNQIVLLMRILGRVNLSKELHLNSPGADGLEPATPIPSLCHGIFIDWSIFSTPFLLWKKASSGLVTQWRQLVSCDWLWHSHRSLIQSRFHLKINRSTKTPWQESSGVACS